jgi:nucleoside-diphosphate-sugar epimerase
MWPASDSVKHSLTFTSDAARSLALLAESENAWNQTWHVPTAPDPPTGKQFVELVANDFGTPPKYRILTRPTVWTAGWFDPAVRELYEMLYQYESDYIFDSTKFTEAFHFQSTSYSEGIHQTAEPYRH